MKTVVFTILVYDEPLHILLHPQVQAEKSKVLSSGNKKLWILAGLKTALNEMQD